MLLAHPLALRLARLLAMRAYCGQDQSDSSTTSLRTLVHMPRVALKLLTVLKFLI
jgi:hypothetical protein